MKLATKKDGSRDGRLIIVSRDGRRYIDSEIVTLQAAPDCWDDVAPSLHAQASELEGDLELGGLLEPEELLSPLPRAYEWIDASAYLNHVILVRKARGAEPPESLLTDPLIYQGGSGVFLSPTEDIPLVDFDWGLDLEGEICVILGDTPQGTKADKAERFIRLVLLCNDISLRNLVPAEIAKGFGFFQSKPATAFSPFAITPDELGTQWGGGRVDLRLRCFLNGALLGDPEAGPEMHFSFCDLIQHITRTRAFTAGTILGSGTVSNTDPQRGVSCLAEKRMRERLEHGTIETPFLNDGDLIEIEMLDRNGQSLFGRIRQRVVRPEKA